MERRNRSIKALHRLVYIDSLEEESLKAQLLSDWVNENLVDKEIEEFNLELKELKSLSELIYRNMNFLKRYRGELKTQLDSSKKIREFLH